MVTRAWIEQSCCRHGRLFVRRSVSRTQVLLLLCIGAGNIPGGIATIKRASEQAS